MKGDGRGGSRHGKAPNPAGSKGLDALPGRMASPGKGDSSFSSGSSGPSPAERLKKASSGEHPCGKGPGRGGKPT